MIENALKLKNASYKTIFTVKTVISAAIIALAVILPQMAHFAVGAKAGVTLLPMYLPILLGSCLLGYKWGIVSAVLSPLTSFIITSLLNKSPMPTLERMPFMMAELAIFALVSGLFYKKIQNNAWFVFLAVISAQIAGRAFFAASAFIFNGLVSFTPSMVLAQIKTGYIGLIIQAILVPLMVMGIKKLLDKNTQK